MVRGRRRRLNFLRIPANFSRIDGFSGSEREVGTHHWPKSVVEKLDSCAFGGGAYAEERDKDNHESTDIEPADDVSDGVSNLWALSVQCSPISCVRNAVRLGKNIHRSRPRRGLGSHRGPRRQAGWDRLS